MRPRVRRRLLSAVYGSCGAFETGVACRCDSSKRREVSAVGRYAYRANARRFMRRRRRRGSEASGGRLVWACRDGVLVRLMSVAEVADAVGISQKTVRAAI